MVESNKPKGKKLCPKCGLPGSGPHERWVRNSLHKKYEPYQYFAHRDKGKLRWCYLGKAENKQEFGLDNNKNSPSLSPKAKPNHARELKQSGWEALEW